MKLDAAAFPADVLARIKADTANMDDPARTAVVPSRTRSKRHLGSSPGLRLAKYANWHLPISARVRPP